LARERYLSEAFFFAEYTLKHIAEEKVEDIVKNGAEKILTAINQKFNCSLKLSNVMYTDLAIQALTAITGVTKYAEGSKMLVLFSSFNETIKYNLLVCRYGTENSVQFEAGCRIRTANRSLAAVFRSPDNSLFGGHLTNRFLLFKSNYSTYKSKVKENRKYFL
jgi:hypothetical protein